MVNENANRKKKGQLFALETGTSREGEGRGGDRGGKEEEEEENVEGGEKVCKAPFKGE